MDLVILGHASSEKRRGVEDILEIQCSSGILSYGGLHEVVVRPT